MLLAVVSRSARLLAVVSRRVKLLVIVSRRIKLSAVVSRSHTFGCSELGVKLLAGGGGGWVSRFWL